MSTQTTPPNLSSRTLLSKWIRFGAFHESNLFILSHEFLSSACLYSLFLPPITLDRTQVKSKYSSFIPIPLLHSRFIVVWSSDQHSISTWFTSFYFSNSVWSVWFRADDPNILPITLSPNQRSTSRDLPSRIDQLKHLWFGPNLAWVAYREY